MFIQRSKTFFTITTVEHIYLSFHSLVTNKNHITTNDEQLDDDEQFDSITTVDKPSENEVVDNSMPTGEFYSLIFQEKPFIFAFSYR